MKRKSPRTLLWLAAAIPAISCGPGAEGLGAALAHGIRALFFEPFRIPSEAMAPGLRIGDEFFADKTAYSSAIPQRGDIIVFVVARDGPRTYPADQRPDLPQEQFVKRIVGIPGDSVAFQEGVLILNGGALPEVPSEQFYVTSQSDSLPIFDQPLDDRSFRILRDPRLRLPSFPPIQVPEGRYFVVGDNREHSKDSRFFGTIAHEDIIGRVTRIYYSAEDGAYSWRIVDDTSR